MTHFPHTLSQEKPEQLGLIVLQADETIEPDFRRLLPPDVELLVSRVPSDETVSAETLRAMESRLGTAASLFPHGATLSAVGYGCTSAASQIGPRRIADLIQQSVPVPAVTEPLSALVAACRHLDIKRLALLSPYVAEVSEGLRSALADAGLETPAFGSFDVEEEARVVRISEASIFDAAESLMQGAEADALFLSCTNLRTLGVIGRLEKTLGKTVLSSNQVLAWHMLKLAGASAAGGAPSALFNAPGD